MYLKLYGTIGCRYRPLSAIRYLDVNTLPTRYTLFITLIVTDLELYFVSDQDQLIRNIQKDTSLYLTSCVDGGSRVQFIYVSCFFFPFDVRVRVQLWFMCVRVSRFVFWDQRFWFTFVSSSFSYGTSAILALHDFFLLFFLNVYVRTWFLICSNFFLLIFLQRTYKHGFRFVYVYMLIS
jgi:hypothetical protein